MVNLLLIHFEGMKSKHLSPCQKVRHTVLAGLLSWLECQPERQKVAGSVHGQGSDLGFGGWIPGQGTYGRQTIDISHIYVSLSKKLMKTSLLKKKKRHSLHPHPCSVNFFYYIQCPYTHTPASLAVAPAPSSVGSTGCSDVLCPGQ